MVFKVGPVKLKELRRILPVQGIGGSCQSTGAQGAVIHPLLNIRQAGTVPENISK